MSKERVWLVKSSHQIMGPFSLSELEERVRNRQVSILDEVTTPGKRWRYVREEPELIHLVREIRDKDANKNDLTVTSVTGSRTFTETGEALWDDEDSEIDIPIGAGSRSSSKAGRDSVKSYGLSSDTSVQKSMNEAKRWVWAGALVAVLAIVGIFFARVKQDQTPVDSEEFSVLYEKGIEAKSIGMKEKALSFLERAERLNPSHEGLQFHLAPLKAILEGQTLAARRTLVEAMQKPDSDDMAAEGYTAIGLTFLLEEDLKQAKSYFEKALSMKRSYLPAVLNLATVEVKAGQAEKAIQLFHSASLMGTHDVLVEMGPGAAVLESRRLGQNAEVSGGPTAETLYRVARGRFDGRQEGLLIAAAAAVHSGDKGLALRAVREALDWDPNMTREHLHLLLIDRQLLSWEFLVPHCQAVSEALASYPESLALKSYCLLRAGDDEGAKRHLTKAIAESPNQAYLRSMQAYLLQQVGREAESSVNAQSLISDFPKMRVPRLLRARQCELDANYDCAVEQWTSIGQAHPQSLEVHKGLGWNAYRAGRVQEATAHVRKGLELSENYLPLIELREVLKQ